MKNKDINPVCMSGSITNAPAYDFCMDSATHLLHSTKGESIRLKADSKQIKKELENFTDAKCIVTVCGTFQFSAECSYLLASWVGLKDDFLAKPEIKMLFGDYPHGNEE